MLTLPSPRVARIEAIRAQIKALHPESRAGERRLPFGIGVMDNRLAGGGLASNALHEISSAGASQSDDAAAALFAAGVAVRSTVTGVVLWVMARSDLFAPGLSQVGLTPQRLLQVEARRDEDVLAVIEEGLRHGGLSAVVGEITRISMTATRRLQLAAEEGRTMAILLRRWRKANVDPLVESSAAVTRWRIACAASTPLPVAGVGRPRWQVSLVRQRGGDPYEWLMEGCDAQGCLALPAEPRNGSATADRREERQAA